MKICFISLVSNVRGHKTLDKNLIAAMATFADVTVVAKEGWYDELPPNVHYSAYRDSCSEENSVGLEYYRENVKNISRLKAVAKSGDYDSIFVSAFDTVLLGLLFDLPRRARNSIFVLHHNNLDQMEQNGKRAKAFSLAKNLVNHVVFEDYIKDHLVNCYGVRGSKVWVVPHPIPSYSGSAGNVGAQKKLVALSGSNDDSFIEDLIRLENESNYFKLHNVALFAKSKSHEFSDGYLEVSGRYLLDKDYKTMLQGCDAVLAPFSPLSFSYRASGTVLDALAEKKQVIGTRFLFLERYEKKYPSICCCFDGIDEFKKAVDLVSPGGCDPELFDEFAEAHSKDEVIYALRRALMQGNGMYA